MKIDLLRTVACALGISISGFALADYGYPGSGQYVSPSQWSNFNMSAAAAQPAGAHSGNAATLPVLPAPKVAAAEVPSLSAAQRSTSQSVTPVGMRQPTGAQAPDLGGSSRLSGTGPTPTEALPLPTPHMGQPSPYLSAAGSPWDAGGSFGSGISEACGIGGCEPPRPELFPWFGGGDVLFWSMANSTNQRLLLQTGSPSTTLLSSRDVDPDSGVGYDVFFGRYFDCGRYAVSLNYLNFDPSGRQADVSVPNPGAYYAAMPHWQNIGYYDDPNDPLTYHSIREIFDEMTDYRVRRNVGFQGLELNFWGFGLGGARRVAPACGSGLSCGLQNDCLCSDHGFGGFGGPLERPCVGTSQIALLHGFRWFQMRDDFMLAGYDHDPQGGAPLRGDQFYNSRTRNDLFGYQVGGRWNYCATQRWNLGVGAKMGVYANNVEVDQRIGGATAAQFMNATIADRHLVDRRSRNTVLAGLGELDLGTGLRMTDAWTIRSGYRVLAASGVATTPSLLGHEMFSPSLSARDAANDSVILHGAYVGTEFNW